MTYRVQWSDGAENGGSEDYQTEAKAEARGGELVKDGKRHVVIFAVGRVA